MERKTITSLALCATLLFIPLVGHAQMIRNDDQKRKQWQSMENGPWDFGPDWYYFFLHKKYSGAEKYWKWAGFKSGFRIRFKEHKSNIKRIMPTRVVSEETQRQKVKKVEEERQQMEEIYKGAFERGGQKRRPHLCRLQGRVQPDAGLHHRRPALLHEEERRQAETPGGRDEPAERDYLRRHRLHTQDRHRLRTGERQAATGIRGIQDEDGRACRTGRQPLRRGGHPLLITETYRIMNLIKETDQYESPDSIPDHRPSRH